jgi:integrase
MDAPKITVFRRAGRLTYEAQWTDPVTRRKRTRSLRTTERREAERRAGTLAAELLAGQTTTAATWETFRAHYLADRGPALAPTSLAKIRTTLDALEAVTRPTKPAHLTTAAAAALLTHLRATGRTPATIAGHLRNLAALAAWAVANRYLPRLPTLPSPPRHQPRARGRPITLEELDRMEAAAAAIVGPAAAPTWQYMLRGLYVSGLRLGEALRLSWDAPPIRLTTAGQYLALEIHAGATKSRRAATLPLTPEAAAFFLATPAPDRRGLVFRPIGATGHRLTRLDTVSGLICQMGKAAAIIVSQDPRKYASAHDLRRSFAARLAPRVRAPILQQLCRHASIQTTLTYYAVPDAEAVARELYADLDHFANSFANTHHPDHPPDLKKH